MTSLDATESIHLGKFSLEEIHKSNSNFLTELVCIQQTNTYPEASSDAWAEGRLVSNSSRLELERCKIAASGRDNSYPSEGSKVIFNGKRKFASE